MKTTLLVSLLSLAGWGAATGATHVWSGAGSTPYWSNPANWSSGGVPAALEAAPVKLVFPANATKFASTPDINNLKIDAIEITTGGGVYTFSNAGIPLTLTGAAGDNLKISGPLASVTWDPALNLQTTCRFNVETAGSVIDFRGILSGVGGITKTGPGNLRFSTGAAANTFTGTMRIETGDVALAKIAGTPCFSGALEILAGTCTVQQSHMIPDASAITIHQGNLNFVPSGAASETLGNINFQGSGTLKAFGGASVTLAGSISCANIASLFPNISSTGSGVISFGSGIKTLSVPYPNSALEIDAVIGDGASPTGLLKTGAGELRLRKANTFTGTVEVTGGELWIHSAASLGSTSANTTIREGAFLGAGYGVTGVIQEPLKLEGEFYSMESISLLGGVIIGGIPSMGVAVGDLLKINCVISGAAPSLTINNGGVVEFTGTQANTYAAVTRFQGGADLHLNKITGNAIPSGLLMDGGFVTLKASHQISDSTTVSFGDNGTLDLNGFSETILNANGAVQGTIALGAGSLTLNGNANAQLGSAGDHFNVFGTPASAIHKKGTGILTIYRGAEPAGTEQTALRIDSGTVRLNANWQGPVFINGGILEGSAKTGVITNQGGTLNFASQETLGLTTQGGGTLTCTMSSDVPFSGYGMMEVKGTVNLTGLNLNLLLGYVPMTGSDYTLISNDGTDAVIGTFAGKPEGAVFDLNGRPFTISYKGGSSKNDVVLQFIGIGTPGPEITSIKRIAGGQVEIKIQWQPNRKIILDSAYSNMSAWNQLGSFTLDADGKLTYTGQITNSTWGVYRLRTIPGL